MKPLDLQALEEDTQSIGHELFALARSSHEHLSVLNKWTSQVLSWCLGDPSTKASVLRFIDVLPSLSSPDSIARHVLEYFPSSNQRLPTALRLGSRLAKPRLLTKHALSPIIRQAVEKVAEQFIVPSHQESIVHLIGRLSDKGATCSFDILGEQVLSEKEAKLYIAKYEVLLKEATVAYKKIPVAAKLIRCGRLVNISVKPSALTSRFDSICNDTSIARATRRILPFIESAQKQNAFVHLDMEHYALRDLTLELIQSLLTNKIFNSRSRATEFSENALGVVIQSYLKDAEVMTKSLLASLEQLDQSLTVRLVKGAYWDYEIAHARQLNWPVPVYQNKEQTDATFERLTRVLLSAHPRVTTAIASHNVRSIAHAMAVAQMLGLKKNQLEFQLLYGMGDALHAAIAAQGYPVRIYVPIGELVPGMAYLVRRILENTANESFLRQDLFQEKSADELLKPHAVDSPVIITLNGESNEQNSTKEEPLRDYSISENRENMKKAIDAWSHKIPLHYTALLSDQSLKLNQSLDIYNPASPGMKLGSIMTVNAESVIQVIEEAKNAQFHWANKPVTERANLLRNAANIMRKQRFELAALEVWEVGKPWREADADIVEAIDFLEYYSSEMERLANSTPLIQKPGEHNAVHYKSRGVAVVIAPWNFPVAILTGMASAALVAGNTVILKPAEQASLTAYHVALIMHKAGIPDAVIQLLPGTGEEIGAVLVKNPDVQTILFTGSREVGLSIIEQAGRIPKGQRFIKHVIAEMGGKNAIIIDEDADLDAAVQGVVASAFGYSGQKCSAASRLIVHESIYNKFLQRLIDAVDDLVVGAPANPETDLGPLIDAAAKKRLNDAIQMAANECQIAYRYPQERMPQEGFYVTPTIVTHVKKDHRLAQDELFGPLVSLFSFSKFDQAIAIANNTDYALTGGVFSRSPQHIAMAENLFDVGNLYINRGITGAVVGRQPFGGHRLSGLGTKAGGADYLLQLLVAKTVSTNTTRHGMPLDE